MLIDQAIDRTGRGPGRLSGTLGLFLAVSLLFSACGEAGGEGHSTPPAPSRLVVKELRKGKGAQLPPIARKPRVTMTLAYTAAAYASGRVYEKRQSPGNPAKIEYGPDLSEGWEQGLAGMRVGGRRELVVPASMNEGRPPSRYVIELLDFKKNGLKIYARELKRGLRMSKREIADLAPITIPRQSGPPPRRIRVIDLRKGSGAVVRPWDAINVLYFKAAYSELRKHGRAGRYGPAFYDFSNTVKGWTVGLPGMRVGGRRELILPPKFVYPRWKPSWGYAPYVTIYVVDALGIEPPKDPYGDRAALRRESRRG